MMRHLLLPSLLLLGACGPMVQIGGGKGEQPQALSTISAPALPASEAEAAAPDAIDPAHTISVAGPTAPGALRSLRIPVTVSDTEIQYLRDASWSEQPAVLFRRLLADHLMMAGAHVIDQHSTGGAARSRLTGELRSFGVDLRAGRQVRVRYDATLNTAGGLRQQRFEQSINVGRVEGDDVVRALNQAANAVAADVAKWVQDAS